MLDCCGWAWIGHAGSIKFTFTSNWYNLVAGNTSCHVSRSLNICDLTFSSTYEKKKCYYTEIKGKQCKLIIWTSKWMITCLKVRVNMFTMLCENFCVYAPPTFLIIESTKYRTGSLMSGCTCVGKILSNPKPHG